MKDFCSQNYYYSFSPEKRFELCRLFACTGQAFTDKSTKANTFKLKSYQNWLNTLCSLCIEIIISPHKNQCEIRNCPNFIIQDSLKWIRTRLTLVVSVSSTCWIPYLPHKIKTNTDIHPHILQPSFTEHHKHFCSLPSGYLHLELHSNGPCKVRQARLLVNHMSFKDRNCAAVKLLLALLGGLSAWITSSAPEMRTSQNIHAYHRLSIAEPWVFSRNAAFWFTDYQ